MLWGAGTMMFALLRLAPGDPATLLLGPDASPADVAALSERLGLDRPIVVQYLTFLKDAARLDFGDSFRFGQPAMDVVLGRLQATVELTLTATVIAVVVGLALGMLAGRRPDGPVDRVVSGLTILLQGMPTFWVGIMLVLLFTATLGLLPSSGTGTPAHIVLPAVTLSLPFTAIVARITRTSVVASMREPYVRTARSKGLTESQILTGHALRNSLVPVVTIVGLQMGALLGGAVVVENVFAWPGLGSLVVESVSNRDYAVVQAAALLIAAIIVVLNLVADLSYSLLDPRVRTGAHR
ncbi:ABC transporter permease [Asanoa iriomotensis]|uniref:Peptide ABC transporter permease n=1 Tax=Asanoa iriomotensis TaxID=234613 RepID=A0ABQ4C189_9ACTN|nr:peptide ABC transporter permease [Asanoa iriomotensis]